MVPAGHIDTVPPSKDGLGDPFKRVLHRRISCQPCANDAKGCVAHDPWLRLSGCADEIDGSLPSRLSPKKIAVVLRAIGKAKLPEIDGGLLIGEPLRWRFARPTRRCLCSCAVRHRVKPGCTAAHADLGENAIQQKRLATSLGWLRWNSNRSNRLGGTVPQLTEISGGPCSQSLPDRCEFSSSTDPHDGLTDHAALSTQIDAALRARLSA